MAEGTQRRLAAIVSADVTGYLAATVVLVLSLVVAATSVAKSVSFEVTSEGRRSVTLTAALDAPEGTGPFPAVVLLHGCNGPWKPWGDVWAERLVGWGYVVFQVDSFGPRGYADGICGSPFSVGSAVGAADAYAAKRHLEGLPIIDRDRIAVMGMSRPESETFSPSI